MLGMAPDYDHLTVIQKVEVFEHAMDSTSGACLPACAGGRAGGGAEGQGMGRHRPPERGCLGQLGCGL